VGNRIIQRSTAITNSDGISLWAHNSYNTIADLIANNEIILNTVSSWHSIGINASTSKIKILHNSIYISGTGQEQGISTNVYSSNDLYEIKNNNIVMESSLAYPIYLASITYLPNCDIDYNNLYAPANIGYMGGAITDMTTWQQIVTTDKYSVSLYPSFVDNSANLELSNYSGLSCPYSGITKDINGTLRQKTTTMGAYTLPTPFDLSIEEIICKTTEVVYPQTAPIEIKILNKGNSVNINNATFGWSVNGEVQPSYTWTASNPLTPTESIEIPIGSFSAGRTNTIDIVVWIENVNGNKDSISWNDTLMVSVKILCTGNNLSLSYMEQLVEDGVLCTEDYTSLKIQVGNTGTLDYDFATNPVTFSIRVNNPEPYSLDTIISAGDIKSGETTTIELTDMFPIIVAGIYDIEVFLSSSVDMIKYDDTIRNNYISGRFRIPVDEYFSSSIPTEFILKSNNALYQWQVIPQGVGADTVVKPQFGTGMLAFSGSPGSMTTLSTQQLDLSRTVQPALSFWYFHDTVPCEDYTDVRITIDGGTTYTTLFSLTKYDPVYGWRQYNMDLPSYAVNQCVILVFEAMEKSRSGNVFQYIDRIRITARQDIAITEILTSPLSVCDLENKEIKVVMTNLSDPALNYVTNPTTLTLEVTEKGQTHIYDTLLSSGSLGRFASDTITLTTDFNFAAGTYTLKAYFSSVLDVDRNNDTLESAVIIDPVLSVNIQSESTPNCITGELTVYPTITINNTGNIDLYDIDLIIRIDTGENNPALYATFTETYTGTILVGSNATYTFANSYIVPWNARYDVRLNAFLNCNSVMSNATTMITECVDTKDLRIVSIDNPTGTTDNIGSSIQVRATLNNRSDGDIFNNVQVGFVVTNSQGIQTASGRETLPTIGTSATISHTFNSTYNVPADSVYYLTVYVDSYENYPANDTLRIKREINVGIETLEGNGFTLGQNIPNPATNSTRIDYSIPESGEVVFYIQSASGQLLYSKTIEAASGINSLEFNTNTLAAGIYIYSIEYKGQRLIKRMSVQK
jgi:hypothetical protein